MKIGVCLPYMKPGIDRDCILSWARRIDAGPFDSLSCGERITGYTLEMRTVLAAAAAVTERVRIIPTLYILPMHSAVLTAKEIATLDVISGGRAAATVGVGGRENDYRAVGASFAKRHERMDRQVAEMRAIWRGEVPFEGCDEVGPRPLQGAELPVYAGVMGPKAMARAARWADGVYCFSMNGERRELESMFEMARQAWRDAGREQPPYLVGGFWCSLAPDGPAALRDYVHDYLKILDEGLARAMADSMTRHSPAAIDEGLRNARAAGADEVFLVPATAHPDEVDRLVPVVEAFRAADC